MFFHIGLEFFHGHQDFTGLGAFFGAYDSGVAELVHDPCGTVEADLVHSLQHSDGRFLLLDNEFAGLLEINVTFLPAGASSCCENRIVHLLLDLAVIVSPWVLVC